VWRVAGRAASRAAGATGVPAGLGSGLCADATIPAILFRFSACVLFTARASIVLFFMTLAYQLPDSRVVHPLWITGIIRLRRISQIKAVISAGVVSVSGGRGPLWEPRSWRFSGVSKTRPRPPPPPEGNRL